MAKDIIAQCPDCGSNEIVQRLAGTKSHEVLEWGYTEHGEYFYPVDHGPAIDGNMEHDIYICADCDAKFEKPEFYKYQCCTCEQMFFMPLNDVCPHCYSGHFVKGYIDDPGPYPELEEDNG